jgi:RNA polymerase sigma factor (sigma-70 family)
MGNDAQRVSAAYYAEIARAPLVDDPGEERKLLRRWQLRKDVAARDAIVKTHLRFVVKMAHKRTKDPEAVKDYIAAGNLGLLKAADKFDTNRKPYIRFLTYAGWWIYEEMSNQDYTMASLVHVPAHKHKLQRRQAREHRAALQEHGPEKVAEHAENADAKLAKLRERAQAAKGPALERIEKQIRLLEAASEPGLPQGVVTPIDAARNTPELPEAEPTASYDAERLRGLVREAIARLPIREQTVLNLCFGVKDEARNLVQIASMMEMCSERVRQLKVSGMRLLHRELVMGAVTSLPLLERTVIERSFGPEGELVAPDDVARTMALPPERVRRIQAEAMRRLRGELHSHVGMVIEPMSVFAAMGS